MRRFRNSIILLFSISMIFMLINPATAQRRRKSPKPKTPRVQKRDIQAHMNFLAGEALAGRGSGTRDEWIAGEYLASMMQQFGVKPGTTDKDGNPSYIQRIEIKENTFTEAPVLKFEDSLGTHTLRSGKDLVVSAISSPSVSGKFRIITPTETPNEGEVVIIDAKDDPTGEIARSNFGRLMGSKASAILIGATPRAEQVWDRLLRRPVSYFVVGDKKDDSPALIILDEKSYSKLMAATPGSEVSIDGKISTKKTATHNSIGKIEGSDPKLKSQVVLLSAHMDHKGIKQDAPEGEDNIYNGADDDASGTTAVIELARVLANSPIPKRTIYFAFFGSEERGGFGSRYFVENLGFPKEDLIANLQWEMLGRPDPKVKPNELWLTGYERSNLGPELAKHGAMLVQDPHPEENFFQRSDNYALAVQGIVAHTVSSYGLHTDYHQLTDEVSTIDFDHMTKSVNSMIDPVVWLTNSDFVPEWNEGMKP